MTLERLAGSWSQAERIMIQYEITPTPDHVSHILGNQSLMFGAIGRSRQEFWRYLESQTELIHDDLMSWSVFLVPLLTSVKRLAQLQPRSYI